MDKRIKELAIKLRDDTAAYMIYQDRSIIKKTVKNISEIQEFARWFLEGNHFMVDHELYKLLSNNLLIILEDLMKAIENNDMVLMNDTLAYGVLEYLKLFCDLEEEEIHSDSI